MSSRLHPHRLLAALLFISCSGLAQEGPGNKSPVPSAPYPPPLPVAKISGTVVTVTDAEVQLTITSDQLPNPGDKADFYFKLPGIDDEVAVGSGSVLSADEKNVTAKFETGTGKPQAGYLAHIQSAAPRWKAEALSVFNARMLAIACKSYVLDYGRYPRVLEAVWEHREWNPRGIHFIEDQRLLHCPILKDDSQIGYEYLGAGITDNDPGDKVLLRSKAVSASGNRVVAYKDGTVKLVPDGAVGAAPSPAPAPMSAPAPSNAPAPAATPPPAPTTSFQSAATSPFVSWLGLTTDRVPIEMIEALHLRPRSGAQVIYTVSGGPAALAGLQKDDIISEIDGEIARDGDVLRLSKTRQPGTKVAFTVSRNLQTYVKEVTFASRLGDAALTEKFRVDAEAGDAGAQRAYGINLINGIGTPVDAASGMNWLTRSAEQNLRSAQALLARIYDEKKGDTDAQAKAIEWFKRAAALGDPSSQFRLALHYFQQRNFAQAADYARMAAEQGETAAEDMYGSMLVNGEGVKSNPVEGVRWIKLAATTGLPSALYHLGNVQLVGSGTRRDIEAGLKNLHAAAEGNLLEAMAKLGALYEEGRLVTRNAALARQWRERAAEARNAVATAPPTAAPKPPPLTATAPSSENKPAMPAVSPPVAAPAPAPVFGPLPPAPVIPAGTIPEIVGKVFIGDALLVRNDDGTPPVGIKFGFTIMFELQDRKIVSPNWRTEGPFMVQNSIGPDGGTIIQSGTTYGTPFKRVIEFKYANGTLTGRNTIVEARSQPGTEQRKDFTEISEFTLKPHQ